MVFTILFVVGFFKNLFLKNIYLLINIFICGNTYCILYNGTNYFNIINLLNTKNNLFFFMFLIFFLKIQIKQAYFYKSTATLIYFVILCSICLYIDNLIPTVFILGGLKGELNTNLLNGLLLIHPPLLYIMYVYVCQLNKLYLKKFYKNTMVTTIVLITLSVFLGSWWAEQELA